MEFVEVVHAETGELLGCQVSRKEMIEKQLWCRSTNVFVMNLQGEILVHQRSMQKERFPGVWCTHLGGHVGCGEDFDTNAKKELGEEAGICIDGVCVLPWRTTKLEAERLWVREYVVVIDKPVEAFLPQAGEVDQFKWMKPEDIVAASKQAPTGWLAGTHDFTTEYACIRAAVSVATSVGIMSLPKPMQIWHPFSVAQAAV